MSEQTKKSRFRSTIESVGIPFVVSLVVTGLVNYGYAVHLENAKNSVAAVYQARKDFDDTHNALIGTLVKFTGDIFKGKLPNQSDFDQAATKTLLQASQLQRYVNPKTQNAISDYERVLDTLRKNIDEAHKKDDLGDVYENFHHLLQVKDNVDNNASNDLKIKSF